MPEATHTDTTSRDELPSRLVDKLDYLKAAHDALAIFADGLWNGAHPYDSDSAAGAFYVAFDAAQDRLADTRTMLDRMLAAGWGEAERLALIEKWRREGKLPPGAPTTGATSDPGIPAAAEGAIATSATSAPNPSDAAMPETFSEALAARAADMAGPVYGMLALTRDCFGYGELETDRVRLAIESLAKTMNAHVDALMRAAELLGRGTPAAAAEHLRHA